LTDAACAWPAKKARPSSSGSTGKNFIAAQIARVWRRIQSNSAAGGATRSANQLVKTDPTPFAALKV
jgi:hypothetical protein